MDETRELAVVVRYTEYPSTGRPVDRIALMNVFDDREEADAEAARLNSVRRDETVEYFVKIAPVKRRVSRAT